MVKIMIVRPEIDLSRGGKVVSECEDYARQDNRPASRTGGKTSGEI